MKAKLVFIFSCSMTFKAMSGANIAGTMFRHHRFHHICVVVVCSDHAEEDAHNGRHISASLGCAIIELHKTLLLSSASQLMC
jgi:hypothetical protein